jgi:hypothetical protein
VFAPRIRFLRVEARQGRRDIGRGQRAVLLGRPVTLAQQSTQLVLHDFEAGALSARCGRSLAK